MMSSMRASTASRRYLRSLLLSLLGFGIAFAFALRAPLALAQVNATIKAVAVPGATNSAAATNLPATTNSVAATNTMPKFTSPEDGWFDVSGFLKEKYGFIPIPLIITEPAVGYGGGVGLMFLSSPLPSGNAKDGLGRPNITAVGGFGTENGTWGAFAGDIRHWFDDRLQTMVGAVYASANLKYYGIGDDPALAANPLNYNLEPKGGTARLKYRFGDSRIWAGLNYALVSTKVSFDLPPGTPGIPAFEHDSNVGGFTPSLTLDTRNNFFTPTRGTYLEISPGFFSPAFGGDDDFQRVALVGMQYVPLSKELFLGVRADASASFGDTPFYLRPFISLRGAPALRYQGEEVAQIEAELRWQLWKRFSLVGFAGCGGAWSEFEQFDREQVIVTGGVGFRYEMAREYGLHVGVDVAAGPDGAAVYLQVGSAWTRP